MLLSSGDKVRLHWFVSYFFIMFKSQDTSTSNTATVAASIIASILGLLYLRRKFIHRPLTEDEKLERDLVNERNLSPCRTSFTTHCSLRVVSC